MRNDELPWKQPNQITRCRGQCVLLFCAVSPVLLSISALTICIHEDLPKVQGSDCWWESGPDLLMVGPPAMKVKQHTCRKLQIPRACPSHISAPYSTPSAFLPLDPSTHHSSFTPELISSPSTPCVSPSLNIVGGGGALLWGSRGTSCFCWESR